MSTDLESRVRQANPVVRPDQLEQVFGQDVSSRLLREIWRGQMSTTATEHEQGATAPTGRRGWVIAAAAAAIVLLAGTLLVVTAGSEPDTAAPPEGTEPIAVVLSAYEALNAGDVDGWMDHYVEGHFDDQDADLGEILAAAGHRKEEIEPCRPVGEAQVECLVREIDDFHGRAGITITQREVFTVNDESRISASEVTVVSFVQPGYYTFTEAFWAWMEDAHPDVHAENRPIITTHLPDSPEKIRVAIEYLDEFLAQSDTYPITDGQ